MSEPESWYRAAMDAFEHANGHALDGGERDLRQALLGLDIAIEATISGFLRVGPGIDTAGPLAAAARGPRASFWNKVTWLVDDSAGPDFPFTASQLNLVRSFRNEIQHGGHWWVPEGELVAVASEAASAVLTTLAGVDSAEPFALASTPVFAHS